ncbi:MAG TPA: hypothetical protein VFC74_06560 [Oscillospiraceae bacterium]|nr:hypothetical protein [Oscillospiraceae bacterium]
MLGDVIKDIRAAEEQAAALKAEAQTEARRIVREAEVAAVETVEQTTTEAEAAGRQRLAVLEEERESLIAPIRERTAAEIKVMLAAAVTQQEAAITMVMERIVKSYGHS